MLIRFDAWYLDAIFQKIADWFRDTYGVNPFWLGSLCLLLNVVFMVVQNMLSNEGTMGVLFDVLFVLLWLHLIRQMDQRGKEHGESLQQTRNPLRIIGIVAVLRLVLLGFVVVDVFQIVRVFPNGGVVLLYSGLEAARHICVWAGYCFASCDTKPPRAKPKQEKVIAPTNAIPEAS